MILTALDVNRFRIIQSLKLLPHPTLNLISGNNGSGKSSILEAIQCLSTGHSFRTRKHRELIGREYDDYLISAEFCNPINSQAHRAGLQKSRDNRISLRMDYEEVLKQANITRLLPVKAITPDSHKLIQEGPEERRTFLDWGLFHVEPRFLETWQSFRRALNQRNQLLRDAGSDSELSTWNSVITENADLLDMMRNNYVSKLTVHLVKRIRSMESMFHVELHYRRGWNKDSSLDKLLIEHLPQHRRLKTTTDGPHRAELAILIDDIPAKQYLSRGQQKVLVYLLHLAQLDVFNDHSRDKAIVLCDDITSELDEAHSQAVIEQLLLLESQVFVTGVDLQSLTHHDHQSVLLQHGSIQNIV